MKSCVYYSCKYYTINNFILSNMLLILKGCDSESVTAMLNELGWHSSLYQKGARTPDFSVLQNY